MDYNRLYYIESAAVPNYARVTSHSSESASAVQLPLMEAVSARLRKSDVAPIRSPLNYTGGKYRLLPQILPLLPSDIGTFVDLFAGGFNVGINIRSRRVLLNDNLTYLVDLYRHFMRHTLKYIIGYVEKRIAEYGLTLQNQEGYLALRSEYNRTKHPLDLFTLTAFSFNHQIRFNNSHEFNTPFGRERSRYNAVMKKNLSDFVTAFRSMDIEISNADFESVDLSRLGAGDLVYCDPPYLITTGTYNDGKRGFTGWNEGEEHRLLALLDSLNSRGIRFALSNVLVHKGRNNDILASWIDRGGYKIHDLSMCYGNSSYHTKDRNRDSTREVLVTNYNPDGRR